MPFEQQIIAEESCARCNATAQVRVAEERGNALVLSRVCPKCKKSEYVGLMTRRGIRLHKRFAALHKHFDSVKTPQEKRALADEIVRVEKLIYREELGLP